MARGRHFLSLAPGWAVSMVMEMSIMPWPVQNLSILLRTVWSALQSPDARLAQPVPSFPTSPTAQLLNLWLMNH